MMENSTVNGKSEGLLSRMALNDNKAGMEGLDRDKINKIIMELSKVNTYEHSGRHVCVSCLDPISHAFSLKLTVKCICVYQKEMKSIFITLYYLCVFSTGI